MKLNMLKRETFYLCVKVDKLYITEFVGYITKNKGIGGVV